MEGSRIPLPHSAPSRFPALVPALGSLAPGLASAATGVLPLADDGALSWLVVVPLIALLAVAAGIARRRSGKAARAPAATPVPAHPFDETQLLELIGLASDWLWRTDAQHRYTLITKGLREYARMDPYDFVGRAPWEMTWAGVEPSVWDGYRAQLAQQLPVRVTVSRLDATGSCRHLELVGCAVHLAGEFRGYHGVGRDITDKVAAERELHESRKRYQEVVESVNEVIFRTDARGSLTFLNHAWEDVTAHSVAVSLGKPLVDFLHPDDRVAAWHEMARVSRGELTECSCQLRLRTRHGEIRWIEATARSVIQPGASEPSGLAGTLDDITARKVAELTLRNINQELEARVKLRTAELEASNRELEAFSYSVSHDLRAPLRAIDGFARILEEELDDRLDANSRSHIERIRKASTRMALLIDDLIELARLTRQSLYKETFDLSEIALQIIEELRAEEPDRKVEVEITTDLMVTADRTLMRVVLENLLHNAWKFSSRREVAHIRFSAERDRERRVFCVTDDGAGFDMAFAANLFRPFHRLHGGAEYPGSGIGLANVQRVIQRHGGRIWAQAEPDRGATFCFTLGA